MSGEVYEPWEPLPDIPTMLNVAALSQTEVGLEVLLQESVGEGPCFRLVFEAPVAYRNINESYRLRTWDRLAGGEARSLRLVRNSAWVAWLREEAGGVLDDVELNHYAILGDEDCVDVVTEFSPTVTRLQEA